MINLKSGAIVFDDNVSVDRQTTLEAVRALPSAKTYPFVAGRGQISIGQHPSGNTSWGVGLVYVQDELKQVWLQCLIETNDPTKDAWSLENEKKRKVTHDRLLEELCKGSRRKEVGHSVEFDFPWGKISSVLDIRGVQALIIVEYP